MNSFYGGLRGAGVAIVDTVSTYADLSNLVSVNYGEYVFVSSENALYRKTKTGYEQTLVFDINPSAVNIPVDFDDYDTVAAMTGATEKSYTLASAFEEGGNSLDIAYAFDDNKNYIGIKVPAPQFTFTSTNPSLVITQTGENPYAKTVTFDLSIGGGSTVSALTNFQSYIVGTDETMDESIYDPTTDQIKQDLVQGQRILIYEKTTTEYTRWYYFGDYNGIKSITSSNGSIVVEDYNGTVLTYPVKGISSITLETSLTTGADEDILRIHYDDNTTADISFAYPKTLEYEDETNSSGVLTNSILKTTDSTGIETELTEINNIHRVFVRPSDYHLLVYYSSEDYRTTYGTVTYVDENTTYTNCVDYGPIKQDNGILIGENITLSTIAVAQSIQSPDRDDIIAYLNSIYSTGRSDGKLVSVGNEGEEKEIYGFNYAMDQGTYLGWYYVGKFARVVNSVTTSIYFGADDGTPARTQEVLDSLDLGGIWFVTS